MMKSCRPSSTGTRGTNALFPGTAHNLQHSGTVLPAQKLRLLKGAVYRREGHQLRAANVETAIKTASPPEEPSENYTAVYAAVAVACCGAFSFGYHLGVLNGPLEQIATELGFAANKGLQGLVVSISLAGAAVGSLAGSGLADSLGRKKAFMLDALPLLLGSALCAVATDSTTVLAGRALVGLGIGFASALVPLYISEVAPTKIRGALGSVNQLLICLGILAALVVNVALPATAWRTMFWIATAPAALMFLGMLFSPETPAHLLATGRKAEAEAVGKDLWGSAYRTEMYGSKAAAEGESLATSEGSGSNGKDASVSWGEMLTGSSGRIVGIACLLFVMQQLSGINAIVYFSSSVFRDAGLQGEALASAAVGVINVVGTVIAASLMDKQGRKQLLTLSLVGQGTAMLAMAAAFSIPALSSVSGPVALIGTLFYVLSFALGTGPVPGLLCAELLPVAIRGRGLSLALGIHWICNFALGQLFLTAVSAVGVSGVYCFFAAVCALGVFFVSSTIVETKGKSPEEIAKLMNM